MTIDFTVPNWWMYHAPDEIHAAFTEEKRLADGVQFIKVYVPESDVLCFDDALELALRRDEQRAYELVASEVVQ